jgi:hypothetical protein
LNPIWYDISSEELDLFIHPVVSGLQGNFFYYLPFCKDRRRKSLRFRGFIDSSLRNNPELLFDYFRYPPQSPEEAADRDSNAILAAKSDYYVLPDEDSMLSLS